MHRKFLNLIQLTHLFPILQYIYFKFLNFHKCKHSKMFVGI